MVKSQYSKCPACGVELTAPKEKITPDGKKTKVGEGQEPSIKAEIDPEDTDDDVGEPGSNVLGFTFTCKKCSYAWFEHK